mgnify:CR=1 FL=1
MSVPVFLRTPIAVTSLGSILLHGETCLVSGCLDGNAFIWPVSSKGLPRLRFPEKPAQGESAIHVVGNRRVTVCPISLQEYGLPFSWSGEGKGIEKPSPYFCGQCIYHLWQVVANS